MKKVYIVTINVDNTETENENKVYGAFADKDKAIKAVADAKDEIVEDLLDDYDEDEFEVKDYVTYVCINVYGNLYEINLYEEYLQE